MKRIELGRADEFKLQRNGTLEYIGKMLFINQNKLLLGTNSIILNSFLNLLSSFHLLYTNLFALSCKLLQREELILQNGKLLLIVTVQNKMLRKYDNFKIDIFTNSVFQIFLTMQQKQILQTKIY